MSHQPNLNTRIKKGPTAREILENDLKNEKDSYPISEEIEQPVSFFGSLFSNVSRMAKSSVKNYDQVPCYSVRLGLS